MVEGRWRAGGSSVVVALGCNERDASHGSGYCFACRDKTLAKRATATERDQMAAHPASRVNLSRGVGGAVGGGKTVDIRFSMFDAGIVWRTATER